MDAAVVAVLSQLDGVLALTVEQRTALRAFLGDKDVYTLRMTVFHTTAAHRHLPLGRDVCLMSPLTFVETLKLTGSTGSKNSDWSVLNY